jgi:Transglycosylase SLT domain
MRAGFMLLSVAVLIAATPTCADAMGQKVGETVEEVSCRTVEQAASTNQLSIATLTRLLWNESRFQVAAVSRAGAQGVAQFMPATSDEQGLSDPFDPEQAIPQAAKLLADLDRRFGNIGLAIAAYNAGPGRVAGWLAGNVPLPRETRIFVRAVTGHNPEEWAASGRHLRIQTLAGPQSCVELRNILRDARFNNIGTSSGNIGTSSGRTLLGMEQSGYMLPNMTQSGRVLPGMQRTGRMLPNMMQSGRMLPGMERSGRMLLEKASGDHFLSARKKRTHRVGILSR